MLGQTNDLAKLNDNNDLDFLFRFNSLLTDENEDSPYSNVQLNGKFHDFESFTSDPTIVNSPVYINLNVQSLNSKHANLNEYVSELIAKGLNIEIIALQEIWTIDHPQLLNIEGFHPLIYKQRAGMRGGGVGFYIKNSISFEIIEDCSPFENKLLESITLLLSLSNKSKIYVTSVYRSNGPLPNISATDQMQRFSLSFNDLLAKMTPNIGLMSVPAEAAMEGGADGIAAINTVKSVTGVDLDKFVGYPIVNGKSSVSGYSGKAVKPIALRFIHEMKTNKKLADAPISGIGGIETWEDCAEFIMLGCQTLQVTTAIMQYGYRIVEDFISGLSHYMEEKGFERLQDMVGLALENIIPAEELDRGYIVYPEINQEKCVKCGRCYISCYDGGHQALVWNEEERKVTVDKEKCVGCHLCSNVCPVSCITKGEIKFKENQSHRKGDKIVLSAHNGR